MRKLTPFFLTTFLLATPALAQARGFDSDLATTVTGPLKLEVVVSENLAHRANNLPKKLSDRNSSSRLNASFANNGRYGEREIEYLLEDMQEEIVEDFGKQGIALSDTAPTRLRITIEMAKPNRPTFNQLRKDTSLSFQSFSVGGAEVSAEIISSNGEVIGSANYDYYPSLLERPYRAAGTWRDAKQSFSRFSRRLSKKLAAVGASSI